MKKALVIIDVQNIMFTYDGGVFDKENVLKRIESLIKKARKSNIPIIYIQHTESEGEFMEGETTWMIHDRIKPQKSDIVIQKNYWDSFMNTSLKEFLEKLGITDLIICGMQSEYCVDTTLRRSFSLGYKSILVEDTHTTFDTSKLKAQQVIDHHNEIFRNRFARLLKEEEILFEE